MAADKLIRMATQIATFFRSQPGPDPAGRVAQHLCDFWDPDMRAALRAALAQGAPADPLVQDAARRL